VDTQSNKPSTPVLPTAPDSRDPIILEAGRYRLRRIRELLRGEGPLFHEIMHNIDELKTNGTIAKDVQPVIVVVKQTRRKRRSLFSSLLDID